jgi:hypothetical protein
MTLEEAQKVADIACTADYGCSSCAWELCGGLQEAFPQFTWTFDLEHNKSYPVGSVERGRYIWVSEVVKRVT